MGALRVMRLDLTLHEDLAVQQRKQQIHRLLRDCVARRAAGEVIPDAALIADHPHLMPELADELRYLRVMDAAQRQAMRNSSPRLVIRCPECRHSTAVEIESSISEVTCSACGMRFQSVPEEPSNQLDAIGRFQLVEQLGVGAYGVLIGVDNHPNFTPSAHAGDAGWTLGLGLGVSALFGSSEVTKVVKEACRCDG